jgi:hypothetical protein
VFQLLMDSLFRSFNDNVGMNNFSELSGCVFSWLEEQCKPQLLQELMLNILQQVRVFLNYIRLPQAAGGLAGSEQGCQIFLDTLCIPKRGKYTKLPLNY